MRRSRSCAIQLTVHDLTKIVTGPDFPTGGFIYGREEIKKAYIEGRGVLQLRARAGIDRIGRGAQERDAIVITKFRFRSTRRGCSNASPS